MCGCSFSFRCVALCRCSHGSWRPDGFSLSLVNCGLQSMVAVTGSCPSFCFSSISICSICRWFSRSGFARHSFLELVGCCHSRLLVGSSAFVMDGRFLWPFPDLVGGVCSCVLMLIHALICVFLVYAGFAAVPGGF